ncbi:hypothetical protein [uncultured Pontibacter sp.]|uniref:hypothetical protein n=1 Tax=uncultured Pontibacter sp. TaxID=453356 RepID=UPI00261C6EE0|nr:hypothetical protein [uncultured Pontibacter sp.]
MQELTRLAKIIHNNNPKVLPVVDLTDHVSLEGRLFQLIKSSSTLSDEEACFKLYGEKKVTPNYRMLKSRLRKKLLNSLLFTELTEAHIRLSLLKHVECLVLIQQANKLAILAEPFLAEKIVDQVISIAQKVELNDILAKAYEIKQYANLLSNSRSKFEKSSQKLQQYFLLDVKEREAQLIYNKLKFEINYNISNFRKQSKAYQESLPLIKNLWEVSGSSKIFDYYHMMRIAYRELSGDYEGVINDINEAERLLAEGKLVDAWFNDRFNNYIRVYAYLRLGRLEEGLSYSKLYLNGFRESSSNWFAFLENYVTLALHNKEYDLAMQLWTLAVEKGAHEQPRPAAREIWGLIENYVQLISHKATKANENVSFQSQYETSVISKDKEGLNFPLIVANYLEILPKLEVEGLEQYAERFGKYSSKYLKGDMGARARLFVKLLLLSTKEEGERLKQKSAPLLEKLKATPPPRDPFAEVEIVPYEHLWDLVLELHQQRAKQ